MVDGLFFVRDVSMKIFENSRTGAHPRIGQAHRSRNAEDPHAASVRRADLLPEQPVAVPLVSSNAHAESPFDERLLHVSTLAPSHEASAARENNIRLPTR